jgi:signal transduction histidine kinase
MTTGTKPAITLRDAAHDLNNLCSTILGFAALAEESDAENAVITAYLTEIRLSAEAIAAIAAQLRMLSQELATAPRR